MKAIFNVSGGSGTSVSRRWWSVAILVTSFVLLLANFFHPVIRFMFPAVNNIIGFALAFLLPWLTVMAIFRLGRRWSNVIAIVAILPTLLYSALVAFAFFWTGFAQNGRDLSFERVSDIRWQRSHIRLYRTNGGAMTDFGVVIRQERPLLPGVALVRNVASFYHCSSLETSPADSGIIVSDPKGDCRTFVGVSREYRLKPFVYF